MPEVTSVTVRLRHDPGPELLIAELPAGPLDEGQQVGGCHDALMFSGKELRPASVPLSSLARHPAGYEGRGIRRGALGRIPGAAQMAGAGGSQSDDER